MNILIVYDSLYGNTEKIAMAVKYGLEGHKVEMVRVNEMRLEKLNQNDLLIVGSPTHGGNASEKTKQFFRYLPAIILQNKKAAVFDTSIDPQSSGCFVRFILRIFGFAARRMTATLRSKGIEVLAAESFFVLGKEGPLREGELDRAEQWASGLIQRI